MDGLDSAEEKKNVNLDEEEEEEEEVKVDPKTLKPDLYSAAMSNDTAKVLGFLSQDVPPTYIDPANSWTPLHWAAVHGNVKILKSLLQKGASEPYHRLVEMAKKAKNPEDSKKNAKLHENNEKEESAFAETKFDSMEIETTVEETEEDLEDDDNEKKIEISVDLMKNTPLLWATYKGHLKAIWLLLNDGYSPNDTDSMGNNALHLAAVNGDAKILKILIDDGAIATKVNIYKNQAIDMTTNKEVRDILTVAMEATASMTEQDVANKHEINMKQYKRIVSTLSTAVSEAAKVDSIDTLRSISYNQANKLSSALAEAIVISKEWGLDEEIIDHGEKVLKKLESLQELFHDLLAVRRASPVRSQETYIKAVYKLEQSMKVAKDAELDEEQWKEAAELILRCQSEYWLSVMLERLRDVVTADDSNEHDMNKLRAAIDTAEAHLASDALLEEAKLFLRRLDSELGMSRAVAAMPVVNLPMDNPPPDYWTENDLGKIEETEGYPAPPADNNNEYKWISSASFIALGLAIERLASSYNGADSLGANPGIIQIAKETLAKAEKDHKILEAKDQADKAVAIEVAKKALKKLKKAASKKK